MSRAAFITDCYLQLLGRLPDSGGFLSFLSSNFDEDELLAIFNASDERRVLLSAESEIIDLLSQFPGKKKLLLFGAYGTGILADRIMPSLIASGWDHRDDIVTFVYSEIDTAPFVFPAERQISRRHRPLNPVILRHFDALIVGGGGLCAWPHYPLWDPTWRHMIPIPYALLSQGVGSPLPQDVSGLVMGARCASARDLLGVREFQSVQPGAFYCPDPSLGIDLPIYQSGSGRSFGRLFVLRGPVRAAHIQIRELLSERDRVVGLEPGVDWPLVEVFPGMKLITSLEQYQDYVSRSQVVISERYHGLTLALRQKKPILGLYRDDHNKSKIVELFNMLNADEFCVELYHERDMEEFPMNEVTSFIEHSRKIYEEMINQTLDTLFN